MDVPAKWIDRVRQHRSLDKLILDLDSSVSQTFALPYLAGAMYLPLLWRTRITPML